MKVFCFDIKPQNMIVMNFYKPSDFRVAEGRKTDICDLDIKTYRFRGWNMGMQLIS